ncbi:MAG: glycosyltransferase family 2 protein [Candidatus Colwellbacteria bacterium]|jgi:cellulose synthase/poly-beta-1,6-N-acetylglucosamine synthase-like glycosyltransferase|nr:glycosyltransferase family 2 protein [Candidatus Colwellbacteria bacterium]MDD4819119.1 glycosyltransferase family 2 protein [Candidatus Colwellbacteria bacterium]
MKRFLEILPGALAWLTIAMMFVISAVFPVQAAVFVILFDIFWFLKTVYFAIHVGAGYREMKKVMKVDWLEKIKALPPRDGRDWSDIYHLVIFPMYKESYAVVKENFDSIIKTDYPLEKFIVVLSGEERAGEETVRTIERIKNEYGDKFFRFYTTLHPADLPGEIPGKGSNEAWAARRVKEDIIDKEGIPYENIMVSTFDVDTQVYPQYFSRLTYSFLTAEHPDRSSYQPIAFFTNNIYEAPVFARIMAFSTTFWNIMNQVRPEQLITFSSHSMPFKALVEIGFWTTNHVSEDSLIFWQCFLHYDGDWRVVPLHYPVSMDANVAPTFWQSMKNIYKQQRRWAWGCENIPFVFSGFLENKKISLRKKIYWTWQHLDIYWGWATNALIILLLGRLPLLLGGEKFNVSVLSYNLPQLTSTLMNMAVIGVITSAILSIALLPPKPKWFKWYHNFLYMIQWALFPVNIIFFSTIPAIESQTRMMLGGKFKLGFWVTPKARKGEEIRE